MSATWPNGVPHIGRRQRRRNLRDVAKLHDLIGTLWLYVGRHTEEQLTTEQKELFADVVEITGDKESGYRFERWWRQ